MYFWSYHENVIFGLIIVTIINIKSIIFVTNYLKIFMAILRFVAYIKCIIPTSKK